MSANQATENRGVGDVRDIYKNSEYLKYNESWHSEHSPWKARQIANILKKNGIEPQTICEVGCGAGGILKELSIVYPDASLVGYEVSPQAFHLCKSKEDDKAKYFHKNIFDEDVHYDCTLCIDVFEHVEDYMGFLRGLKSKSTYKIFHIPLEINVLSIFRSIMLESRKKVGHLHYFSRETALATLEDCGYELIDNYYTKTFLIFPRKTIKNKVSKLIYETLYSLSQGFTVKLFGDCSLIVLAK